MSQNDLDAMLEKINQAMAEAKGDKKKEAVLLGALIDPADATACEGCQ